MDWDKFLRVSSYWANIEMIKFGAPNSSGQLSPGAKFLVADSAIAAELPN